MIFIVRAIYLNNITCLISMMTWIHLFMEFFCRSFRYFEKFFRVQGGFLQHLRRFFDLLEPKLSIIEHSEIPSSNFTLVIGSFLEFSLVS